MRVIFRAICTKNSRLYVCSRYFIKVQPKPDLIGLIQFSGWIDFRIELSGPQGPKSGWFRSGLPQMVYNQGLTQSYSELNPNEPKPSKNGLILCSLLKTLLIIFDTIAMIKYDF